MQAGDLIDIYTRCRPHRRRTTVKAIGVELTPPHVPSIRVRVYVRHDNDKTELAPSTVT